MPICRFRNAGITLATMLLLAVPSSAVRAQDEAVVEALAPVLAAEDARRFEHDRFERGLAAPEPIVRRVTATAIGRVGDRRGTELLLERLEDPDSTVRTAVVFALGLLRDETAVEPLIGRLTRLPALDPETSAESVTALARTGGQRVGEFFRGALEGSVTITSADPQRVLRTMVAEAWRLGAKAPVGALLSLLSSEDVALRAPAVFSVGRLRSPAAGDRLVAALRDVDGRIRADAARALTRSYVRSAGLSPATVAGLLARASDDAVPGVRINAMRSLGSFGDSAHVGRVAPLLNDQLPNVQVQAAATLGELGGSEAARELRRIFRDRDLFAVQREALLGLARVEPAAFLEMAAPWRASADWRHRAVVAEGMARMAGDTATAPTFLRDADGRVIAAGLQAWAEAVEGPKPALVAAARRLIGHPDAAVRVAAAGVLERAADPVDIQPLVAMYRRTTRDSVPDPALGALGALAAIARASEPARARVDREFLRAVPRPGDYLLRGWAEANWRDAAELWGPAYPIQTGRTLQDYRDIVRAFVVAVPPQSTPHVFIETDQQGTIEIELFGGDAPLTVANFLRLVDRRFFDGNRWHRVVPNFVVQDGDPRGDGAGGPGGAIRDEINRRRYDDPVLGMALSGPDTGSSQWFINLSPQPHLDGVYTVFGRVVDGVPSLIRITQGDLIRMIRR